MQGGNVFLMGVSIIIFGIAVYLFFTTHKQTSIVSNAMFAYGANGFDGDILNLVCPPGKTIKVTAAVLADTQMNVSSSTPGASKKAVGYNGACDPFEPDGLFNPKTTSSTVLTQLTSMCNGKNSCQFTVPAMAAFQSPLTSTKVQCGGAGKTMLIGSYQCK